MQKQLFRFSPVLKLDAAIHLAQLGAPFSSSLFLEPSKPQPKSSVNKKIVQMQKYCASLASLLVFALGRGERGA